MTDSPADSSRSGARLNNYATVLAILLSVAAILISLLEVSAIRAQQRASVWPYLSISQSYSNNRFELAIENKGVGPARISEVDWRFDGAPITDLDALIREVMGEENAFSYETYQIRIPEDDVMAAGEKVILFGLPMREDTQRFLSLASQRISLEACYCSIHDDCWRASLTDTPVEATQDCA